MIVTSLFFRTLRLGVAIWLLMAIGRVHAQFRHPAIEASGTLASLFESESVERVVSRREWLDQSRIADDLHLDRQALSQGFDEHTINLDHYTVPGGQSLIIDDPPWHWQALPKGLVYRPYMAGRKEPRLGGYIISSKDDATLWEGTMGAQVGLLRFGNNDPFYPEGFQLDVEAAADIRLDLSSDVDVRSADYRAGLPLSYGYGRHRTRFGYYHLSSHLGDEFMISNPGFTRLNFSRDVLILGHCYFIDDRTRVYGEMGWAFASEVSEPWEFQFGIDHASYLPTGLRGAPFYALHGHLREELNFGGYFSMQVGWAWVGERSGNRLRMGLFYLGGESSQYSFFDEYERVVGFGVWYDL